MAKYKKSVLQEVCDLLDTYKGRDKVLRTLCYSSKLIGGLSNSEITGKRFSIFSSQMSATRAVLRLLDDLPMLQYTLEYGLGKHEPDNFLAALGVATNTVDQLYYPIEKMAWLAEHKLISVSDSKPWDTASSVCWVLSIYLTLMKTLRHLAILHRHRNCDSIINDVSEAKKLLLRQRFELLTCLRLSMDLVHAINTLPSGFLWASKLKPWQVGLIGTLSSVLGLYQVFAKRAFS